VRSERASILLPDSSAARTEIVGRHHQADKGHRWHGACVSGASASHLGSVAATEARGARRNRPVETGEGVGKSIVVINDSPELLELAEMLLRDEDFDVKLALLGTGALELIRTTTPDLVILDVRLPDVSGWDILQALKLDPETADIPVLICSAAVQELRSLEAQLARMGVDVLIKPFAIDTLIEKARALTDGRP
jgi:CheY-like chemotaxis protein